MDLVAPAQLRHEGCQERVREGLTVSMRGEKKAKYEKYGLVFCKSCKSGGVFATVQMGGWLCLTEVIHLRQ